MRPTKNLQERMRRIAGNQRAIEDAKKALALSPLGLMVDLAKITEDCDIEPTPEIACVDPFAGIIYLHVAARGLNSSQWQNVLGHLLLHLAFNHAARCEGRDPALWHLACDLVTERMLESLGMPAWTALPKPSLAMEFDGSKSEETVYDHLAAIRKAEGSRWQYPPTLAGKGVSDLLGLTATPPPPFRTDFEARFLEGVRRMTAQIVAQQAEETGEALVGASAWPPLAWAQRWVSAELPLLGSLAVEIRVFADSRLCESMDISVAAVNGYLGEMYFHTDCAFSYEEVLFVYVHELLHVALFHHTRLMGRDPWVWNLACDFVINAWLVEMGVGKMPRIGTLFDPRLNGMSAEEVYDLLIKNPRECRKLRGFRGGLPDVLLDAPFRRIYRNDVTTLDDVYRRCLREGVSAWGAKGRGVVPAALLEEIKSLYTPPVPWDVELARWMERNIPLPRDWRRTYARVSRRQASTPDIPRPARYLPHEAMESTTFGVVMDTSGSMDRELLGRALGAISSYATAREVPLVRLVLCDAQPYDRGYVDPTDLRGVVTIQGRGGTVLQPAVTYLCNRPDFPSSAPVMILTDGWCEEKIYCPREHCFVLPRKHYKEGSIPLHTSAPVFRVLKDDWE